METNIVIPASEQITSLLSRIDQMAAAWKSGKEIPAERLASLRETARLQAVSASCKLAGIRVTEAEVAALLREAAVPFREGREVLGYAKALEAKFPARGPLVTTEEIRELHALAMGTPGDPPPPTPWRTEPYHLEMFDDQGHAVGRVFQTLPPRLVSEKMEELVSWLEIELRRRETHPLLVIGAFNLHFIAACPFAKGNGRMANLLLVHLLRRTGYEHIPYVSIEQILHEMREELFDALDAAETRLWRGEADLTPWLVFHLRALETHGERLKAATEQEPRSNRLSPLQAKILETVHEHGLVGAGLLLEATGASRNTLKDNLRRMVERGVLQRLGERRGARYRLAGQELPALAGPHRGRA